MLTPRLRFFYRFLCLHFDMIIQFSSSFIAFSNQIDIVFMKQVFEFYERKKPQTTTCEAAFV